MKAFKNASRQHCKFKEGDFFTFKFDRRKWGFGRILIDVAKRRKMPEFARLRHAGLNNLMGKALIVKVYLTASDTSSTDLDALAAMPALPAQAIMDNCFYYGEYKIIGHRPLELRDLDGTPISFSKSISHDDPDYVYLQRGYGF
ncbi:immunity 26/phosphotriesterase HocA family protein [Campylobacter curvus]|uniref:immunity 26/phosphotriesterase HocA family protein n=1 Tax=Campylobacter curvus TaxID=200 RepID=UPI00214F9BD3|nr:immunity 26/phosphotriesterase HocA family protein [Campylobacter curvus]